MKAEFTNVDGSVAAVVSVTSIRVGQPNGSSIGDGDKDVRKVLLKAPVGSTITVNGYKSTARTANTPTRMVVSGIGSFVAEWVANVDPPYLLTSPPRQRVMFFAAKLLDIIPEPIAPAEVAIKQGSAMTTDAALADRAEAAKVRELCSLSRRQDYFDVPLSVLVEAQLRQERSDMLRDVAGRVNFTSVDVDQPLRRWREAQKASGK